MTYTYCNATDQLNKIGHYLTNEIPEVSPKCQLASSEDIKPSRHHINFDTIHRNVMETYRSPHGSGSKAISRRGGEEKGGCLNSHVWIGIVGEAKWNQNRSVILILILVPFFWLMTCAWLTTRTSRGLAITRFITDRYQEITVVTIGRKQRDWVQWNTYLTTMSFLVIENGRLLLRLLLQ